MDQAPICRSINDVSVQQKFVGLHGDPLDEIQQTHLTHLESWKFFEHMQSLLPSPSFFAGADQGATSNDARIQTSGAFRCHLPSQIRPFPKHKNLPSSVTEICLRSPLQRLQNNDNTLWTSHDLTIRLSDLSASQHFKHLQDSVSIPGSLQKWQATAPQECRVQGNSLLPSSTFGTRTNYLKQ